MTSILLPDTIDDEPALPAGVRALRYHPGAPLPTGADEAEALVVWTLDPGTLTELAALPRLRWVQTLAAGPDAVLAAGFAPSVAVTSGRGLHDGPVAEHVLALTLSLVRRVPAMLRAQHEHRWAGELGGAQPLHPAGPVTTLLDARVTIWGFGSIATRLAGLYSALGAHVTGVATHAGPRGGYPVVAADELPALLPRTDVLVGLLPATPATRHAIGAEVFGLLPAGAFVVNAGRGATLDEAALLAALHAGHLGGAALDVFETEPLPATSPLWDEPDVLVSPHGAGGRPIGSADLIAENVRRFVAGEPLRNLVVR
ncbi:NAD(P)-dependent oxidoreductase [Cellulomonas sp. 73-92]|uniref:NAD(P)-dependent oxidoreductase n=1 Tax=Cellulomonas sp. 73-92 TaxID=1895740 RepID=UPI000ABA02D7|nr:NAD(P)-dependent oxidoreductase [Cellulomonas sp. 73-92]